MQKYLVFLTSVFLIFIFGSTKSFAYANGQNECVKCHTLNKEQAKSVLGELIPDVKILSVERGPVSGVWEIGFESGGKKSIIYLDYSFRYIIAGNVISIKTKSNLTEESFLKISKVDVSQLPVKNALLMGEKSARNKVFVFDDTD